MPKEAMEHDAKYFRRLCEILEPENILCLGKMTFVSVYESLMNEKKSKPKNFMLLTHFKQTKSKIKLLSIQTM